MSLPKHSLSAQADIGAIPVMKSPGLPPLFLHTESKQFKNWNRIVLEIRSIILVDNVGDKDTT